MDRMISAIVPVGLRFADVEPLYHEYKAGLAALGEPYEIIFALDGPHPAVAAALHRLKAQGEKITVIQLTRRFGEAAALMAGYERSTGDVVLTLPAYPQVAAADLNGLRKALEKADLAIAYRSPRAGGPLERLRRWAFHSLLGWVTRLRFRDLGCGVRMMRRPVLDEVHPYGDQHRFLAVLADRLGFRVQEVPLRQSPADRFRGHYRAREYANQILDIFNVFFLVRFTKRPLRFFGSLGALTFGLGMALICVLVMQRLFFGESLSDRPALLLSSLLAVLGMQLFALGLLGELIIFTHARDIKDYRIERIVQMEPAGEPADPRGKPLSEDAFALAQTALHMPREDGALPAPTTARP